MADEELRDFVLAQFDPLEVSVRPLFGGHGFYLDGAFFGFIADGRLYFRADEESRPAYRERGMTAFHPADRPRGPRTVDRNFEVPPHVLEDPVLLRAWAEQAAAAQR